MKKLQGAQPPSAQSGPDSPGLRRRPRPGGQLSRRHRGSGSASPKTADSRRTDPAAKGTTLNPPLRTRQSPAANDEPGVRLPKSLEGKDMLSAVQVAKAFQVSRQTIYRWTKRTEHPFPKPRKLSPRVTRFDRREIEEWFAKAPMGDSLKELIWDD